ncbi:RNA 2',3'-cyclic phosphodiesterase, partial [Candidatus Woesearchaeota archaeon]|nr:RNA 2',3'-cyclic phosphodiesterase [Candidatus Woesearchaeota archaeon]
MRLFIAFDVSEEVKNYCRQIQKILPDSNSKLVEDFHLTLRFLGEYDENETKELISNFSKIKFNNFVVKTDDLGVFPNENFIKVIWLGLEPKDKIKKLKEQIEKALKL